MGRILALIPYMAWLTGGLLLVYRPTFQSRAGKILVALSVLMLLLQGVAVSYNLLRFLGAFH